ncbi:unnamed protein product [marine sediment metagenome]|uniref:Uncharacterized protein n=1 Tax=marine sediment metagenome TaxID=412755 RepID=X1TQL1_9ZZZZ
MTVYIISKSWRQTIIPGYYFGRRYHLKRKQLFSDPAMAKAKSHLPDSYYKLLLVINYGFLERNILMRRIRNEAQAH